MRNKQNTKLQNNNKSTPKTTTTTIKIEKNLKQNKIKNTYQPNNKTNKTNKRAKTIL